jgi:hypothetical protein
VWAVRTDVQLDACDGHVLEVQLAAAYTGLVGCDGDSVSDGDTDDDGVAKFRRVVCA